jgi:hypothetical protein
MNITRHSVEKLEDPTGILAGDRYEFFLNIEVPEEDELYSEKGLLLRVIYLIDENDSRIVQYQFMEETTEEILDFELEDDEEALVREYCKENIQ